MHVAAESVFICTSCIYSTNKALKGGAIYLEGNSRTEIMSSTFDRNIATENGSAFYITSSTTDPISSIS